MATIRMSRERKNELKIMKAVNGRDYIIREICVAFNEAHKDVKHEPHTNHSYGGYTIDVADGLLARSIQNGVFINLYMKYVYTEVKSDNMRHKIGQQYTTGSLHNPVISQADEPVRYKYECKEYIVDGLKGYLVKILTELTTMEKFNRSVSHSTLTVIENMIAWIKLEGQLPADFQIVGKKRSPRCNGDFVVRSKAQYKGTDYRGYNAIGIEHTDELREILDLMESALDVLGAYHKAASNLSSITFEGKCADSELGSYQSSLDRYKADLESIKEKADGDLDAAIRKDDAERLEINEYLSNVPNSHLLLDGSRGVSVNWVEQTLAYRVQGLTSQIENYTRYVKQKKLAIKKAESEVPVLEYKLNLQKLKEFAMLHDLLVQDGEEE
tara:strand:- start:389 stop:1540 length:1152 start_codon:yes stop_codon:yes gene_type:complete